jgi:hypothetical protein
MVSEVLAKKPETRVRLGGSDVPAFAIAEKRGGKTTRSLASGPGRARGRSRAREHRARSRPAARAVDGEPE